MILFILPSISTGIGVTVAGKSWRCLEKRREGGNWGRGEESQRGPMYDFAEKRLLLFTLWLFLMRRKSNHHHMP